jgi:hypothetical protein
MAIIDLVIITVLPSSANSGHSRDSELQAMLAVPMEKKAIYFIWFAQVQANPRKHDYT